jgi:hypothetical protein
MMSPLGIRSVPIAELSSLHEGMAAATKTIAIARNNILEFFIAD